jgi:hypothetical protein
MYGRFGVHVRRPDGRRTWVTVRCFAPDHPDRHKSARVNLDSGGFKCFGCLRSGGALDALQLLGVHDRDEARNLAVEYGVLEPDQPRPRRRPIPAGARPGQGSTTLEPEPATPASAAAVVGELVDYDNLPAGPSVIHDRAWVYVDEHGDPVGRVHRHDLADGTKRIWQERPDGDGWTPGLEGAHLPLYRLPTVLEHARAGQRVLVVEGEKAVDALDRLGVFATTNAGGAGKWRDQHTAALHGATVLAVCDCDLPGRLHAINLSAQLLAAAARVLSPLDPDPNRNDGYDLVDHLAGVADTIRAVTPDLTPTQVRARLRDHLDRLLANQLPTNPADLHHRLEFTNYTADPAGHALLVCDRCDRRRVHRLSHGIAYCPCGGHQAATA